MESPTLLNLVSSFMVSVLSCGQSFKYTQLSDAEQKWATWPVACTTIYHEYPDRPRNHYVQNWHNNSYGLLGSGRLSLFLLPKSPKNLENGLSCYCSFAQGDCVVSQYSCHVIIQVTGHFTCFFFCCITQLSLLPLSQMGKANGYHAAVRVIPCLFWG